jgi:type I restriction enzyme R subunit
MLKNIMTAGVTEQNLDDFNRFSDLRITIDNTKTKAFLEKVLGKSVASPFVISRWSKVLKDFILDAEMREKILKAWLNEGETIDSAQVEKPNIDDMIDDLGQQQQQDSQTVPIGVMKGRIEDVISFTLSGISQYMRPMKEIVDTLFYVIDKQSIDKLDSVGMYLHRAFTNLYKDRPTIVDKSVAFNLLVTKFEAYLKKLYYLYKGEEVKPQHEGEDVTWANVIHDVSCLWQLKFTHDDDHQRLYQYLLQVKEWRNDESHISPTATEQEIDGAVNIILTMYCYATGMCVTDLEMAGHDIQPEDESSMAAEPQKKE